LVFTMYTYHPGSGIQGPVFRCLFRSNLSQQFTHTSLLASLVGPTMLLKLHVGYDHWSIPLVVNLANLNQSNQLVEPIQSFPSSSPVIKIFSSKFRAIEYAPTGFSVIIRHRYLGPGLRFYPRRSVFEAELLGSCPSGRDTPLYLPDLHSHCFRY
jgi:hypothetical protein